MDKKLSFEELMALLLLIIFAAILYVLAFYPIPKDNMTLFASLVGNVVVGGLCLYFGYVWGSSKKVNPPQQPPVENKDEPDTPN